MAEYQAFQPSGKSGTKSITAGVATSNVRVQTSGGGTGPIGMQWRIYNAGAVPAFVNWGDSTVTASLAADMPIQPGGQPVIITTGGAQFLAAITASGTAVLYITPGTGF